MSRNRIIVLCIISFVILSGAFLSDYKIPDGYSRIYRVVDGLPMCYNMMFYYVGTQIFAIGLAALAWFYAGNKLLVKILFWLLLGKLGDLFIHPFSFAWPELIVKVLCVWEILQFLRRKYSHKGIVS